MQCGMQDNGEIRVALKGKKKAKFQIRIRQTKLKGVQIPHAASPSPFLAYHLSLDHGGVVMSTSPQVTMTTAQGEALAREVIASLGMQERQGECEQTQR